MKTIKSNLAVAIAVSTLVGCSTLSDIVGEVPPEGTIIEIPAPEQEPVPVVEQEIDILVRQCELDHAKPCVKIVMPFDVFKEAIELLNSTNQSI